MSNEFKWENRINNPSPMKLKILGIKSETKSVLIADRKPDKRFTKGYRLTGTKSPKLCVNTTLTVTYSSQIRIGLWVLIPAFGKMIVADINKSNEVMLRSIEQALHDNYSLSIKIDDYIDVLPLGSVYMEGSNKP